ncbi:MAG: hypothetical protein KGL53_12985, partial [Elusimicrobia bacterium]|nr:hypothetical protein [Elusimicrobiota bacterium]
MSRQKPAMARSGALRSCAAAHVLEELARLGRQRGQMPALDQVGEAVDGAQRGLEVVGGGVGEAAQLLGALAHAPLQLPVGAAQRLQGPVALGLGLDHAADL